MLISNAAIAFLLNIAAVFLVGAGSGLVLTLAGVFKDILLITGSVLIFGAQITPVQVVGYSIALLGLILYKTPGSKSPASHMPFALLRRCYAKIGEDLGACIGH